MFQFFGLFRKSEWFGLMPITLAALTTYVLLLLLFQTDSASVVVFVVSTTLCAIVAVVCGVVSKRLRVSIGMAIPV